MLKTRHMISIACVFLTGSLCTLPSFAQAANSEKTIVKENFPQELTADSEKLDAVSGYRPDQYLAYTDADLDGTGKENYIVAVYSNGFAGAIRVFKKEGTSATLVAAPTSPRISGILPSVRLRDVDGDGRPEIIAGFSTVNGAITSDTVWKWNGKSLHCISPVLYGVLFIDLTGNGKLSAISRDEGGQTDASGFPIDTAIYNLVNGRFVRAGTSYLFSYFNRYQGPPHWDTQQFSVPNLSAQYEMTIVNGAGTHKLVSSATIKLNGTTIASQQNLIQKAKVIKVPVTLKASNTVSVKLRGAPGSRILVSVGTHIAR